MQIPGNAMSFHFGQGFCARTRVTSSYLKTQFTGNATRTQKPQTRDVLKMVCTSEWKQITKVNSAA